MSQQPPPSFGTISDLRKAIVSNEHLALHASKLFFIGIVSIWHTAGIDFPESDSSYWNAVLEASSALARCLSRRLASKQSRQIAAPHSHLLGTSWVNSFGASRDIVTSAQPSGLAWHYLWLLGGRRS